MLSPYIHKPSEVCTGEIAKLQERPKASTTALMQQCMSSTLGSAQRYGNNVDDATMDNPQRSHSPSGTFRDYNATVARKGGLRDSPSPRESVQQGSGVMTTRLLDREQTQKGVTGFLYDETDMPTTADGIRPDVIFNPLSLITRMTTGVVFEGMMAKLAAHTGTCPEATMFKKLDTDNIADMLEHYGFNRNGTVRLYNGMTGNYMDAEIFMAPIMYQTLQKYTIDTVYSNSISPTDAMTHQPLHGKKLNGALKAGSMETACLSVSSMNFLGEKIGEHSDGIEDYICANCGSRRVVVNEDQPKYTCNNCGDLANIVKFKTSHSSRLFFNELEGMSCGVKYHVRKPVFEVVEEESKIEEEA